MTVYSPNVCRANENWSVDYFLKILSLGIEKKYSLAGKKLMGSSFYKLGELSIFLGKRNICTEHISWNNRRCQRFGMTERQDSQGSCQDSPGKQVTS